MGALSLDRISDIQTACEAGAGEVAGAVGRTFDQTLAFDAILPAAAADLTALGGPGLVFSLLVEDEVAAVIIPESAGLLPDWYRSPDPTGQSKLMTLAQELGMLLLPEDLMPLDFKAAPVAALYESLAAAGLSAAPGCLRLKFKQPDKACEFLLAWPLTKPVEASAAAAAGTPATGTATPGASAASSSAPGTPATGSAAASTGSVPAPGAGAGSTSAQTGKAQTLGAASQASTSAAAPPEKRILSVEDLPGLSRSLLKVQVPVIVTLAQKQVKVDAILRLCTGSVIQFDKSCEEFLTVTVNGKPIAEGEAVKVGDTFGVRIASFVMPDERFLPVVPRETPRRASA